MKTYDRDTKTHNFYSGERYGLLLPFLKNVSVEYGRTKVNLLWNFTSLLKYNYWSFCRITHNQITGNSLKFETRTYILNQFMKKKKKVLFCLQSFLFILFPRTNYKKTIDNFYFTSNKALSTRLVFPFSTYVIKTMSEK